MPVRPTKIGARDPKTGKWWVLWTDGKSRLKGEKPAQPPRIRKRYPRGYWTNVDRLHDERI